MAKYLYMSKVIEILQPTQGMYCCGGVCKNQELKLQCLGAYKEFCVRNAIDNKVMKLLEEDIIISKSKDINILEFI